MIIDDNATISSSSSFTVHHGALKPDQPDSPPPGKPRRRMVRRRSVDFMPAPEPPEVKEVERLDEASKTMCWYSRNEYDIIKARNSLIVKMMKTGHFKETDGHSFRGLEHKLKEGFKQRRANKFNALNAVLEEQDRQMSDGVVEPEKIARQYRRVSLNAGETAMFVGMRDAEVSSTLQPSPSPPPEDNLSEMTPSTNDTEESIASPEHEQQNEIARLEVRGLFAAASMMKRGTGRMGRRSSM